MKLVGLATLNGVIRLMVPDNFVQSVTEPWNWILNIFLNNCLHAHEFLDFMVFRGNWNGPGRLIRVLLTTMPPGNRSRGNTACDLKY